MNILKKKRKKICILYGNCVGMALNQFLKEKRQFHDTYEIIHHPIHPQVIQHFNLQWIDANAKYRHYDFGWFGFEEFLKRYIELK